jgi:hypothetical protein
VRERERERERGELETGFDREVGRFVLQLLYISKVFLSFGFSRFELRHFACVVFVVVFLFSLLAREREREGGSWLFVWSMLRLEGAHNSVSFCRQKKRRSSSFWWR